MATSTRRPDKVLGMHFMNPVPVMRLIEYVRTLTTSDETLDRARMNRRVGAANDRARHVILAGEAERILEEIGRRQLGEETSG